MGKSMLRVAAATAIFGAVHSLLASRAAKKAAAGLFGERNRNGLYRVFFISQSFVTFAALAAYIRRQPSRELYHLRGPVTCLMHAGQLAAILATIPAAHQVGIPRILGLTCLRTWLGDGPVPPEPEAQGPALDAVGRSHPLGPFAWTRHPLNAVPVPVFWLWPRMTTNLLAFNTVATAYLVLGSLHEEARLRETFGERYAAYQSSGVRFFVPSLRARLPIGPPAPAPSQSSTSCSAGNTGPSTHVRR